jgi:integrase
MKPKYTEPKLSKAEKGWFIHYRYEGKQFRETMGLNKITDLKKRESEYNELAKVILADLKSGWNPNLVEEENYHYNYNVIEALELGLEYKKKTLSKSVYSEYAATIYRLKESIIFYKLNALKISELNRVQIKKVLNRTTDLHSLSPIGYNKCLIRFKAVLTPLVDEDILETNPVVGIKRKKIYKKEAHVPASFDDMVIIKKEILTTFPNFYNFVTTIFHTGIRPEELLKVKIFMIDLKKKEIELPEYITKNGKSRVVPVNDFLLRCFNSLDVSNSLKENYLFGTHTDKFSHHKKLKEDYVPATNKIRRREATELWRVIVKDKLNIDMNLYAIKKHGANEKILAGLSISALKELFGHSSEFTTATYITKLKEINRKEIIDKSPDF